MPICEGSTRMLEKLLNKLQNETIIHNKLFEHSEDIDELLDLREEDTFDSKWMNIFSKIQKAEFTEEIQQYINQIREVAFMKTYQITNSSDISAYVSDDFELIAKCYVIGIDDTWMNGFILSYANGKFPCGTIEETDVDLFTAMKKLTK